MPRNSSGVYSLPIAAFAPGGLIKASDHNSNYGDIATALTQSLATTGVTPMTGQIKAFTGTAAAPSYAFNSALATGFFLSGANQIGWAANSSLAGTFNADGSVNFSGSLAVAGTVAAAGAVTAAGVVVEAFASGTILVCGNSTAPTHWVKLVDQDDAALRIVAGAVGSGGTVAFSSLFNASITNLAAHTHTASVTDPGHHHSYNMNIFVGQNGGGTNLFLNQASSSTGTSTTGVTVSNTSSGSGASTTFEVKYSDCIRIQKA